MSSRLREALSPEGGMPAGAVGQLRKKTRKDRSPRTPAQAAGGHASCSTIRQKPRCKGIFFLFFKDKKELLRAQSQGPGVCVDELPTPTALFV